jgi:hypothetical protein
MDESQILSNDGAHSSKETLLSQMYWLKLLIPELGSTIFFRSRQRTCSRHPSDGYDVLSARPYHQIHLSRTSTVRVGFEKRTCEDKTARHNDL